MGDDRGPNRSHRVARRETARMVGFLVLGSAVIKPIAAHGDHASHSGGTGIHPALPAAMFFGSVLIMGTAVYLDRIGELGRRWADAGITLGIVGLLAAVALLLV